MAFKRSIFALGKPIQLVIVGSKLVSGDPGRRTPRTMLQLCHHSSTNPVSLSSQETGWKRGILGSIQRASVCTFFLFSHSRIQLSHFHKYNFLPSACLSHGKAEEQRVRGWRGLGRQSKGKGVGMGKQKGTGRRDRARDLSFVFAGLPHSDTENAGVGR